MFRTARQGLTPCWVCSSNHKSSSTPGDSRVCSLCSLRAVCVSSTPAAMLRAGITPGLKLIPSAVLWGYFAYMAADSLPGSQFWDRLLLVFTDPRKRYV
jgi:HCO3- transporter family